jgi:hypothetical protein
MTNTTAAQPLDLDKLEALTRAVADLPETTQPFVSTGGQVVIHTFSMSLEQVRAVANLYDAATPATMLALIAQARAAHPVQAGEAVERVMEIAHRWAQAAYAKALNKPGEDIDSIKRELRASLAPVSAQQSDTDDEWDRNAERLTREMGIGGGKINPNATSIDDLFMDEDEPVSAQQGAAEQHNAVECDPALRAEPASQRDADERAFFEHWDKTNSEYGYGETHIIAYKAAQAAWNAATRCRAEGGDTSDNGISDLAAKAPAAQLSDEDALYQADCEAAAIAARIAGGRTAPTAGAAATSEDAQPELMRGAVASVAAIFNGIPRINWMRPERVEVGTLLYCATQQEGGNG